ncbi:Uncharacterised protein [Mycobacteroides abscessus subsp. abscessus]|nr:Uncharacterised protein [Mycobacteroides abscessus subsp. abscessus]
MSSPFGKESTTTSNPVAAAAVSNDSGGTCPNSARFSATVPGTMTGCWGSQMTCSW